MAWHSAFLSLGLIVCITALAFAAVDETSNGRQHQTTLHHTPSMGLRTRTVSRPLSSHHLPAVQVQFQPSYRSPSSHQHPQHQHHSRSHQQDPASSWSRPASQSNHPRTQFHGTFSVPAGAVQKYDITIPLATLGTRSSSASTRGSVPPNSNVQGTILLPRYRDTNEKSYANLSIPLQQGIYQGTYIPVRSGPGSSYTIVIPSQLVENQRSANGNQGQGTITIPIKAQGLTGHLTFNPVLTSRTSNQNQNPIGIHPSNTSTYDSLTIPVQRTTYQGTVNIPRKPGIYNFEIPVGNQRGIQVEVQRNLPSSHTHRGAEGLSPIPIQRTLYEANVTVPFRPGIYNISVPLHRKQSDILHIPIHSSERHVPVSPSAYQPNALGFNSTHNTTNPSNFKTSEHSTSSNVYHRPSSQTQLHTSNYESTTTPPPNAPTSNPIQLPRASSRNTGRRGQNRQRNSTRISGSRNNPSSRGQTLPRNNVTLMTTERKDRTHLPHSTVHMHPRKTTVPVHSTLNGDSVPPIQKTQQSLTPNIHVTHYYPSPQRGDIPPEGSDSFSPDSKTSSYDFPQKDGRSNEFTKEYKEKGIQRGLDTALPSTTTISSTQLQITTENNQLKSGLYLVIRMHQVVTSSGSSYTDCIQCPSDQEFVAKQGSKCVPLIIPPIIPCSGSRPIHLISSPRWRGRILPEGVHTIHLLIKTLDSMLHHCLFKYHIKVNRCEIPPLLSNGRIECSHGHTWGSRCHFYCNPGYSLIGSNVSECSGTNHGVLWTHPMPFCLAKRKTCMKPLPPNHGKVTCSPDNNQELEEGSICNYVCNEGFVIPDLHLPKAVIHCKNGDWNKTMDPQCIALQCPEPPQLENGFLDCNTQDNDLEIPYKKGVACHYACNEGYVIPTSQLPNAYITCNAPLWSIHPIYLECHESLQPMPKRSECLQQTVYVNMETGFGIVKTAEFITANGRPAEVVCTLDDQLLEQGLYNNICEATDPELRTSASCKYAVKVTAEGCSSPPTIANGRIKCPTDSPHLIDTTCQVHCDDGYTIPLSQKHDAFIRCHSNFTWADHFAKCTKQIEPQLQSGTCNDATLFGNNPSEIVLPKPIFITTRGTEATVHCNVTHLDSFGEFINHCKAVDSELQTHTACSYTIKLKRLGCSTLYSPTNGNMSCRSVNSHFRCDIECKDGYYFPSDMTELKKGYVKCLPETGHWDFQITDGVIDLPDCLGSLPTTSLQTDLQFKVKVYDCDNQDSVSNTIKEGLVRRNQIICDQIDCTDFSFLCHTMRNLSLIETVWNVMTNYTPYDDYSEEAEELLDEAESLLTKIQDETQTIVYSDISFHQELFEVGAKVVNNSYQQSKINFICVEKGYVVDFETSRCLQCPSGTFYIERRCEPCPENTYQNELGQFSCKPCPSGKVSKPGSKQKESCTELSQKDILPELPTLDEARAASICEPNPCKHGGSCVGDSYAAFCICQPGFEGGLCEKASCPAKYCHHGGTCTYQNGRHHCICPQKYTGHRCETLIVPHVSYQTLYPCASSPCLNGGVCIPSRRLGHYKCVCEHKFIGKHCEYSQCPAVNFPYKMCLNGGSCAFIEETHAMVCLCTDDFIGARCEIPVS